MLESLTIPALLDILVDVVTILGVPAAIYTYYRQKKKERKDAESQAYNGLDDKYVDYLRLCLEHPDLDIFDVPDAEESVASGITCPTTRPGCLLNAC